MSNETWGFDMEAVEPEEAFPTLPAGTYTFEVVEVARKRDKNNNPFLHPKLIVLDTNKGAEYVGKSYMPYLSLANDRIGYTKRMLMDMGASISNNDGPNTLVGCVFEADLVRSGEWLNLRHIRSQIESEETEEVEEAKEAEVPPPRRRRRASSR